VARKPDTDVGSNSGRAALTCLNLRAAEESAYNHPICYFNPGTCRTGVVRVHSVVPHRRCHFLKEKTHNMSATAKSPLQQESKIRKPPTTARESNSQASETSMQEDLANLAYGLWQERGCPYGSPEVDWLEAERKLSQPSENVSR
jgi:hypothetical protein